MIFLNIFEIIERGYSYFIRVFNEWTIIELARDGCKGVAKSI